MKPEYREAPDAIEARALTRRYGAIAALDDLDLTVRAGECVLLLGANGAGKSTLLGLLATLIRPTSGGLRLFGEDARARGGAVAIRRRIGFLSHRTFLYDHLTGRENLLFYARLYDLPDPAEAARDALMGALLAHRGDDRVATYSRGMQQRLAIARALLHRPDLLLLDEPFSGLDRESVLGLEERLGQERRAGRTCVLATHDPRPALRFADRALVLYHGRPAMDTPAGALDGDRIENLLRSPAAGGTP